MDLFLVLTASTIAMKQAHVNRAVVKITVLPWFVQPNAAFSYPRERDSNTYSLKFHCSACLQFSNASPIRSSIKYIKWKRIKFEINHNTYTDPTETQVDQEDLTTQLN